MFVTERWVHLCLFDFYSFHHRLLKWFEQSDRNLSQMLLGCIYPRLFWCQMTNLPQCMNRQSAKWTNRIGSTLEMCCLSSVDPHARQNTPKIVVWRLILKPHKHMCHVSAHVLNRNASNSILPQACWIFVPLTGCSQGDSRCWTIKWKGWITSHLCDGSIMLWGNIRNGSPSDWSAWCASLWQSSLSKLESNLIDRSLRLIQPWWLISPSRLQ